MSICRVVDGDTLDAFPDRCTELGTPEGERLREALRIWSLGMGLDVDNIYTMGRHGRVVAVIYPRCGKTANQCG
ncbi:MAG: hypothetical protein QW780_03930 [Sulfolobales archaeon]